MTRLTADQTRFIVETIKAANKSVEGTLDYLKYNMQTEALITKDTPFAKNPKRTYWHFLGYYYPMYVRQDESVMIYKVVKNNEWLYYGDERYLLTENIKSLFKNI